MEDPIETLRPIANKDGRFSPEALAFLLHSLPTAQAVAGKENAEGPERHITGQELLAGMRQYAHELFGPLAAQVWRSWGVHASIDWGHIVFLLVDAKLLNRQETDTVEDFRAGFDFDEAFVKDYRPELAGDVLESGGPFGSVDSGEAGESGDT